MMRVMEIGCKEKEGYKWEKPTLLEGKRPISIVALKEGYKAVQLEKLIEILEMGSVFPYFSSADMFLKGRLLFFFDF